MDIKKEGSGREKKEAGAVQSVAHLEFQNLGGGCRRVSKSSLTSCLKTNKKIK